MVNSGINSEKIYLKLTQVVNQIIGILHLKLCAEAIPVLGNRFKFYIQDGGYHPSVESG